jgi:hypothetical protein
MALHHNPRIVTSGLVLSLDAADINSYPGSGTTWKDLSGNGNNAILNGNANNPTWDSAGYWNFPATSMGLNGGMFISASNSLNAVSTCTIEILHTLQTKTLGDSDWMCLISKSTTRSNQTPAISINQGTSSFRYLHIERPSAFNSAANLYTNYTGNLWYHTVAVISSTSFGYLNSTQVSTSSGGMVANNFPIYLGLDSELEMFKGKMAIVRIYNRALTPQEILQNYLAQKSRFGL